MSADVLTYVVPRWNEPTETFVRREVAAALAAGETIRIVSLKPPAPSDGVVDDSALEIFYPSYRDFVIAIVRAVFIRPKIAAGAIRDILRLGRPGTWISHLIGLLVAYSALHRLQRTSVFVAHFAWISSTVADHMSRLTGKPYAVFVHAYGIYDKRCQDRYLSDRLQRALVVFVESESIANDVRVMHGVEPIVMRMGVPHEFVVALSEPRPTDRRPTILSVGALREKKGHDVLIRAAVQISEATFLIAGEGPEREKLQALISDLGLSHRVHLLGHQDVTAVAQLLDEASVFCLASRPAASGDRDGVPNVLIEAMARATPIVATTVSGIPDLLRDIAILVPPNDSASLAAGLLDTIGSPEETWARAMKGLERVRQSYTTAGNWSRLREELDHRLSEGRSLR